MSVLAFVLQAEYFRFDSSLEVCFNAVADGVVERLREPWAYGVVEHAVELVLGHLMHLLFEFWLDFGVDDLFLVFQALTMTLEASRIRRNYWIANLGLSNAKAMADAFVIVDGQGVIEFVIIA